MDENGWGIGQRRNGTGEATGTAAALSIRDGVHPGMVDVKAVQESLRSHGAVIDENDIAAANSEPQFWEK